MGPDILFIMAERPVNGADVVVAIEDSVSLGSSSESRGTASMGTPTPPSSPTFGGGSFGRAHSSGPKYKLIHEGDIQLCRLNHTRTIVSKIMNSKYLRRWEAHHIELADNEMRATMVRKTEAVIECCLYRL